MLTLTISHLKPSLLLSISGSNGKVERSPVFRLLATSAVASSPRHIGAYLASSGQDDLFISYRNGRVTRISGGGTETAVTLAGWVDSNSDGATTHTVSGGVFYMNREDRVPWGFRSTDSAFQNITGWDATWRCKALRSYNSALIALNVTKGSASFPTMVKTSGFASANAFPTSWDATTPGTNATENPLVEMRGQLLDGHTLGSAMILYSSAETWLMQANTSTALYAYRRLFGGEDQPTGIINTNCVVEVSGKHYVFGVNDIWVHDGLSSKSIAHGRVREFIYSTLNAKLAARFFVSHNPNTKTVHFCYISGDRGVAFNDTTLGCNRAASYNYADDTWSFDDLPFVNGAAIGNYNTTALTWATATGTWASTGGSWQDQNDGFKRPLLFLGDTSSTYSLSAGLYGHDLFGSGSILAKAVTWPRAPQPLWSVMASILMKWTRTCAATRTF
jgi:hypothetical protein